MKKKYVFANWKMNHHHRSDVSNFFDTFQLPSAAVNGQLTVGIAPQLPLIPLTLELAPQGLQIGAQNCSSHPDGAHTGEVSCHTLQDLGTHFVIVGHSERRQNFAEDGRLLREKISCAMASGLTVIFCVGEQLTDRQRGEAVAQNIVAAQIHASLLPIDNSSIASSNIVLAYEPVWAIGTGETATPEQAQSMHAFIRELLKRQHPQGKEIPLLYGGSVRPDNFDQLLQCPDIDGALVGGAGLSAPNFQRLCETAAKRKI